ncbi:YagK/YfjJ domain-containing protein [Vibrio sp. DNB22_17_1]
MRYLTNSEFVFIQGEIWEVNTGKGKFKICPKHIKAMISQLNTMCELYRRVFFLRFDLHLDHYTDDNEIISRFEKRLFPSIKAKYKVKHIGFFWVREMEKAKQQHYHFAVLLDGKKIRYPDALLDLVQLKWMLVGGGHVHTPKNCYCMIEKNAFQDKQEVIYRLSYFAKERGKGHRTQQAKDYGMSRLQD